MKSDIEKTRDLESPGRHTAKFFTARHPVWNARMGICETQAPASPQFTITGWALVGPSCFQSPSRAGSELRPLPYLRVGNPSNGQPR